MLDDDDIGEDGDEESGEDREITPLLPPRETPDLIGHGAIDAMLREFVRGGNLPHAVILSGARGIGKATSAFRFARFLLARDDRPEAQADAFRRVASGGHPDLLVVERPHDDRKDRQKDAVDIDSIRKIAPFMHMTASVDGGWRVAIVDDADTMTNQAQNAILKILEEPPSRAVLILVCHRLGGLIPTIRSRCRVVPFLPLTLGDFTALAVKIDPGLRQPDLETLYALTGGSIGDAQAMMEEGGLAALAKLTKLLADYPRWNWPEIHALAESLGRAGAEDAYRTHEKLLRWSVDAILRAKALNRALPEPLKPLGALAAYADLRAWTGLRDALAAHLDRIRFANLDRRQGVIGAFTIVAGA